MTRPFKDLEDSKLMLLEGATVLDANRYLAKNGGQLPNTTVSLICDLKTELDWRADYEQATQDHQEYLINSWIYN